MTKTRVVWFIALLIGGITWWVIDRLQREEPGLPPLHTVQAEYGDISQRVVAHGNIQPVENVTVGSQVSGIIEDIQVDFNSLVQKNDVLAQIESSTFQAEVSSAEAELESARARLELAQIQYQRILKLRKNEFSSVSEEDEAFATLKQAEADVKVREHALERAQRELSRSTITSPVDGIVIARLVDVGQTVAASLSAPALFEIAADLDRMWIHANVSEADIGLVQEGNQARFQVDAYRDQEFEGEVIQVRNAPLIEDNVVHYETIIEVNNSEFLLKPGMTAEVSIIVNERTDVLRLRNTALRARLPDAIRPETENQQVEGDSVVYLLNEGQLVARSVLTGLNDGVYTEILDGLEDGDILAVGLSLQSGQNRSGTRIMSGEQAQY